MSYDAQNNPHDEELPCPNGSGAEVKKPWNKG